MSQSVCEIHLHRNFGFFFRRVRGKGMAIDQATKELLGGACGGGMARARRVVERVLSMFPWESACDDIWCGVHPLLDASLQNTFAKVWTLRVVPARAPEVLRTLMPIARQLGVSLAVPYFNFFVDAAQDLAEQEVYPEKTVAKFNPEWNEALDVPRAKKKLYEGLTNLFAPLGFAPHEGSIDLFSLKRPLDEGRSYQRVFVCKGRGVAFEVCSDLLRSVKARAFGNQQVRLEHSWAVREYLSNLREQSEKLWAGDNSSGCWATDEDVKLALEDTQRLMVPMVERLTSAKGVYDWYFDPAWTSLNSDSLSDWPGFIADESEATLNRRVLGSACSALLMARLLPDAPYWALLDDWERKLRSRGEPSPGAIRCLKYAAAYRQMPRLSEAAI